MKVNQKILSIPPYISTSWKNVISLHLAKNNNTSILVIGLVNGATIEIPHLETIEIEMIFNAHQKYLEQDNSSLKETSSPNAIPGITTNNSGHLLSFPVRFGIEDSNMGSLLQHNSEASNSPDLPKEILERISTFSKAVGFENLDNLPKPEPHCNCMHCQIMRAIRLDTASYEQPTEEEEEEVSDKDLKFRDWDVVQIGQQLFVVANPLNSDEHYNVFLGKPVGCTCGQLNCEHIRAVLNS